MKTSIIPLKFRILILLLLSWKIIRTDWIVVIDYEHMGITEARTYLPPAQPLWDPPHPNDTEILATSWKDDVFVQMGQPRVTISLLAVAVKITLGFIVGCILLWISNWIARQIRWFRDFS